MWRSKWGGCQHYHSFNESLFVLKFTRQSNLSPQAQAVKELLMSVISSPVMEKRQWQLVAKRYIGMESDAGFIICYAGH
ncbi:hypothetical protein ACNKHM_23905 [Shigella sonnei]